jgi:hypothetical protein
MSVVLGISVRNLWGRYLFRLAAGLDVALIGEGIRGD